MRAPTPDFKGIFDTLKLPVVVCGKRKSMPVVFMNASARLVLRPGQPVQRLKKPSRLGGLRRCLRFSSDAMFETFRRDVLNADSLSGFPADIITPEGNTLRVKFFTSTILADAGEFVVVYMYMHGMEKPVPKDEAGLVEDLFFRILHEAYQTTDIDGTIRSILALAGEFSKVSRVYIFEEISPETTRNTYEWCAPGVEPAIGMLQNLRKDEYNYADIISRAAYIFGDTRVLPAGDRRILYDMQGIKSIAILTLYHQNRVLGYIGFDDTVNHRKWTGHDILVLEGIATVASTLINRRNAEKKLADSRQAMRTVIDSLEDLIFVTDLDTYELKFVSKSLAQSQGVEIGDLLGKVCWKALRQGQAGPCKSCPIPEIYKNDGNKTGEIKIWEFQSDLTGKWYLVKDSIITWVDGTLVHLGTAVDITYRMQYEEQLKYLASTDAMTAVYNREWGYNRLKKIAAGLDDRRPGPNSLVFFDLDKLKPVNDKYGHAVGDKMIIDTVKTVFACIRKDDFICRWGGDEFILSLHCDQATAAKVMRKIEFAVGHFNQISGKPYVIAFSYGVVEMPVGCDVDALIQEADLLMYKQKMEKRMRGAISERRFVPPGAG